MCEYCEAEAYFKTQKIMKSLIALVTYTEELRQQLEDKTGEMYIRYSWKTADNRLINGYMHGIYYQKNMLINLTMEWADNKGKQNAINAFTELKQQLDLKYDLKI